MSQDNSSEINEEDKLTPKEVQALEIDIPTYLRKGFSKAKVEQPVENRSKLTSQEAHQAELKDSYEARQNKNNLREELSKKLNENPGGVASSLDPINYNDVTKGEPTVPYIPDPAKVSNN